MFFTLIMEGLGIIKNDPPPASLNGLNCRHRVSYSSDVTRLIKDD